MFLPFSNKISKCRSSCNNINDPYAKLCLPNVVKIINVKVFNLMSRTNETRHKEWHGTCKCKCKCRLDGSVVITNSVGMMINAGLNANN